MLTWTEFLTVIMVKNVSELLFSVVLILVTTPVWRTFKLLKSAMSTGQDNDFNSEGRYISTIIWSKPLVSTSSGIHTLLHYVYSHFGLFTLRDASYEYL